MHRSTALPAVVHARALVVAVFVGDYVVQTQRSWIGAVVAGCAVILALLVLENQIQRRIGSRPVGRPLDGERDAFTPWDIDPEWRHPQPLSSDDVIVLLARQRRDDTGPREDM